ncbi:LuxR C-terminal-related transcriptional regulator [Nocardia callitridis]|uniref:Isoniazid response ATPase/transcriptional regulator IniR n=1 Tax=Nocardia callitridis TaxID=648753 RepID=A0ABP9JXS3_9NOCA
MNGNDLGRTRPVPPRAWGSRNESARLPAGHSLPALGAAFDTIPRAREIFRALDSAEQKPVVYLIRGRSETGKSTLLSAIRARLRARGIPLADDPTTRASDLLARSALVVDDAHTLGRRELESLCATIESRHCTVVVATRPHPHDRALRTLTDIAARRGRVVDLRALGVVDIAPFARELGMMVPRHVATHIHQQTAGIRGGVVAALDAARSTRTDAGTAALDAAIATWARTLLDDLPPELWETLVVAAVGTGLDPGELTETLGIPADLAQDHIDRVRATALVTDADLLLAPAVGGLRTLLGDRTFLAVQRTLLNARLDAGLLRDHTALLLAESGVRDPRLAEFLSGAADKAGAASARYYAAAAAAGAERDRIALRWAEAAARAGDSDTALRLAEPMLIRTDLSDTDLASAVRVCAGVLTNRGLVGRAAQLYSWLGAHRVGADWSIGATVLYLAGDAEGAEAMTASASRWPPTEATARDRLIVAALAHSMRAGSSDDDVASAVSELIQATHAGDFAALPCGPETIATLLCLGTGQPRRAEDALNRAVAGSTRADAATHGRQRVLAAWTAMLGGDEFAAAATCAALDTDALDDRDRLLAFGLEVGLARRTGDRTALAAAWQRGRALLDEVTADLLALLPIGELWLAAIELDDERRVTPLVEAASTLVSGLGEPPAWATVLRWYGIRAALAREDIAVVTERAGQLAQTGEHLARTLAAAGQIWARVRGGEVEVESVRESVRALHGAGMSWDAAALASEAARASDGPASTQGSSAQGLRELARMVRADSKPQELPATGKARDTATVDPAAVLSDREREVVELVLLGLTYREIGARLYISAKTVEHHVARIRRRLGARSRAELLSMLRAMGHGSLLV